MMKICNPHDLRVAYGILRIHGLSPAYKQELKREIRRYTGRPAPSRRIVESDDDSCTVLVNLHLPADKASLADADECFLHDHYLEAPRSSWDCTGALFTMWYKPFVRRGEWWAYHRVCRDV